jgi:predicted DNA-binding transcriptional regulator YafY
MASLEKIPRLSRLTGILLQLQSRQYVTVADLAGKYAVSKRTIYRDMRALEEAGVPLVNAEPKGFSLLQGYNIPPVMFSQAEANALLVAEKMMERTRDQSLIECFRKMADKVRSVLNDEQLARAEMIAERTIIGRNWHNERNSNYLAEIQQSLAGHRVLEIDYLKADSDTPEKRQVEPFALYENTYENWVLIAWCRLRDDFRTFRMDRILALRTTDDVFPAHELTLEEYIARQKARYARESAT